ncbi:hypothetical protein Acsp02_00460 [Actinoplanes sp. NBRC 103695]|nr:hypothetical protein Acsp02_00460 [Actinoplanes sp. NBRC 103695]
MIEELIREAQGSQADRALPVERIRSGLAARIARARRRRQIGLGAGAGLLAAAVATAIVIPTVLVDRDRHQPAPALPAAPTALEGPMGYQPAWLPDGFTENARSGFSPVGRGSPGVSREWNRPGVPRSTSIPMLSLGVTMDAGTERGGRDPEEKVDIKGVEGSFRTFFPDKSGLTLSWSPDGRVRLSLQTYKAGLGKEDLLRIAESMVPSPDTYTTPLRFRTLPSGWRVNRTEVEGPTPKAWKATVWLQNPAGRMKDTAVRIEVGTTTPVPDGGTELAVGGHPARTRLMSPGGSPPYRLMVVELDGGRMVSLIANGDAMDVDLLSSIAENTVVTGAGVDWLGTR